jgi:hypothetical protein
VGGGPVFGRRIDPRQPCAARLAAYWAGVPCDCYRAGRIDSGNHAAGSARRVQGTNMTSKQHGQREHIEPAQLRLRTLLYRFIFFDWLFADVGRARTPIERHAATQHNRRMSKYLPVYLRRWSFLTVLDFALGALVERALQATLLSAWFYTWSCIAAAGAVVIAVAWIFLAQPQQP